MFETKQCMRAQAKSITVAKKEPAIAFADQRAIPVGSVARQVFCIDKRSNFSRVVVIVDYGIDSEVLVGYARIVDGVLTDRL